MEKPLPKPDDLSKPRIAPDPESTLVCVIEMSRTSWLVGAGTGPPAVAEAVGQPSAPRAD
jgi:hypothetical protein